MGSTKWGGQTPPTLKTRWISSYFSHDSTHFVEETGGEFLFPNAKRVERAPAVRKLLLPGSGCLEFPKEWQEWIS